MVNGKNCAVYVYLSFNGSVASNASDAEHVAKHSECFVDLPACLDYCNALVIVDVVCSRITHSVDFVVSSAQCRYFRNSCSK